MLMGLGIGLNAYELKLGAQSNKTDIYLKVNHVYEFKGQENDMFMHASNVPLVCYCTVTLLS